MLFNFKEGFGEEIELLGGGWGVIGRKLPLQLPPLDETLHYDKYFTISCLLNSDSRFVQLTNIREITIRSRRRSLGMYIIYNGVCKLKAMLNVTG